MNNNRNNNENNKILKENKKQILKWIANSKNNEDGNSDSFYYNLRKKILDYDNINPKLIKDVNFLKKIILDTIDPRRALGFLLSYLNAYPSVKNKLKDKNFILEVYEKTQSDRQYPLLYTLRNFRDDEDIALAAINKCTKEIEYISDRLRNDENFLLAAYRINPEIVNFLPDEILMNLQISGNYKINFNKALGKKNKQGRAVLVPSKYNKKNKKYKKNKLHTLPGNITNHIKSFLGGSSQFVHIPNYGKRKVRFQKNGRAYVIVNKKKLKLN